MKNENLKMYISYEEPFNGKAFTSSQMYEVYRDLVDKTEYQDFESWLYDMIKSGVFRIITKTSNCFETEKRMIQLINTGGAMCMSCGIGCCDYMLTCEDWDATYTGNI